MKESVLSLLGIYVRVALCYVRVPLCYVRVALCYVRVALCYVRVALCYVRVALCCVNVALLRGLVGMCFGEWCQARLGKVLPSPPHQVN